MKNSKALRSGATMAIVRTFFIAMAAITLNLVPSTATAEIPEKVAKDVEGNSAVQAYFSKLKTGPNGRPLVQGQQGEDIAALCLMNGGELVQAGKLKPSPAARALLNASGGRRVMFRGEERDDRTRRVIAVYYGPTMGDEIKKIGILGEDLDAYIQSKGARMGGAQQPPQAKRR